MQVLELVPSNRIPSPIMSDCVFSSSSVHIFVR